MGSKYEFRSLGDLADFSSGGTPSKKVTAYWNGDIPWISAKTLKEDDIYTSNLFITQEGLAAGSKIADAGSLLILTRGSGLFKDIPIGYVAAPVAFNQDIKAISVTAKNQISSRFLFYALKSCKSKISEMVETTGIGAGKLSADRLLSMKLPIPNKEIQQKILSIVRPIDNGISLNNQINDYLLELATVRFEQALISESDTFRFSELVELEDSKREPLNSRDRETRKGIYPYYGATSIMDYIDDYLFDGIRVLVGEDGTVIQEDGKPVLQYVWGKYWVNNHAHVLRSKSDYSLEAIYIALARTAISHIVTGAVQMKISQKNLNNLELEMPQPSSLRYLEDIFTLYRKSTEESKMLERLRDLLLPRLMSGEIDVSKIDITQLNNHLSAD
ncbi:MAG: restriction endonuclease subunit S [Anaerovoracaceae bacterium]